jgi:hypothetical protein
MAAKQIFYQGLIPDKDTRSVAAVYQFLDDDAPGLPGSTRNQDVLIYLCTCKFTNKSDPSLTF